MENEDGYKQKSDIYTLERRGEIRVCGRSPIEAEDEENRIKQSTLLLERRSGNREKKEWANHEGEGRREKGH